MEVYITLMSGRSVFYISFYIFHVTHEIFRAEELTNKPVSYWILEKVSVKNTSSRHLSKVKGLYLWLLNNVIITMKIY
jgi:hypothetical protein